jgi:predicted nucleotidyltransferase
MAAPTPTEKSVADLIKQLEKARAETQSYSETWADVGRKIKNSINPLKDVEKKLEAQSILVGQLSANLAELERQRDEEGQQNQHVIDQKRYQLALAEQQLSVLKRQATVMSLMYDTLIKLIDAYDKYDKLLADNAVKQGISRVQSEKQAIIMQRIVASSTSLVVNLQEALEAVAELNNNLGVMAAEYMPMVAQRAAELSQSIGISATESAQFFATLGEIGNTSLQAQQNMAGVADAAAKAAGVPLGKVIKDVSGASSNVRTIFRGNTIELIKQSAELRKIGSSLDQAAKSAESLLNFESSVGAELKASALLGQNINFNQSRRLFFEGKIAEGEKALQKELERVGDIDKLNYFQRKALSELTGKDINELQKIGSLKKTQQKIDQENPDLAKERLKLEKELAKVAGSEVEQKKRANELAAIENVAKTRTAILDAQKEQAMLALGKAMKPLMDIVRAVQIVFFKLLATIADFGGPAGIVIAGLAGLTIAFFAFKKGVKLVADFLADAMGNAAQKVGEGIGKGLEGIGKGLRNFGRSVQFLIIPPPAILAIGVITLALIGLGYALKLIGQGIGAAAPAIAAISTLFLGLASILADTLMKVLDKLPELLGSVTTNLVKLALVGPGLVLAAAGVGAMGYALGALNVSLRLFPLDRLTNITTQLTAMSAAAEGVSLAVGSLKELSGVKLPNLDISIDTEAINALAKTNEAKRDETAMLKQGIDLVAQRIDVLTSMMAAGKIAVYMDRVKVSKELAEGTLKFGVSGQATNAI